MKIIEAMKRVKINKEKIVDLQKKIAGVSAHLSIETPAYGDNTKERIKEWMQACNDLAQDNVKLLCAIARTNLAVQVTIALDGKAVTKPIAEWVWRRREYAAIDTTTWSLLTDRNLKEQRIQTATDGPVTEVKIIRNYDIEQRDRMVAMFKSEPHEIDSALEVVNAVTDLIEV